MCVCRGEGGDQGTQPGTHNGRHRAMQVDNPRPVDMTSECCTMLEKLMMAQAQVGVGGGWGWGGWPALGGITAAVAAARVPS